MPCVCHPRVSEFWAGGFLYSNHADDVISQCLYMTKGIHSLAIWSEHKLRICFALWGCWIKVNDSVTMHFTKSTLIHVVDYIGGIMLPDWSATVKIDGSTECGVIF